MAKASSTNDFRIASQEARKAATAAEDLMASGSGIPWEDRGTGGLLPAFFKTAFGLMFKPVATLRKMRRPETAKDANLFSFAIAGVWFLATIIQSTFNYFVFDTHIPKTDVDPHQYMINSGLEAVLAAVASIVMTKIAAFMYFRLTAFDMVGKAPPVLSHNCVAYITGASILALIPGGPQQWLAVGPILAGFWMFALLIPTAIARLRIRIGAAIIGSTLTFLGTAAIVVAGILVIHLVWCTVMGNGAVTPILPIGPAQS